MDKIAKERRLLWLKFQRKVAAMAHIPLKKAIAMAGIPKPVVAMAEILP